MIRVPPGSDTAGRARKRARPAAVLLLVFVAACATTGAGREAGTAARLGARIDAILDAPPLHRTSWGVLFQDAATGAVLFARNPDRHFIPASNTKLVIAAVALGTLGPDWRYRTEVLAAPDSAGTATELRVVGRGDPSLSARFWGREHAAIEALADSIAAAGVRRVAGPLVIDVSYFRDAQVHSAWEVGDLPATYAAPVSAFAIEEGSFAVVLRGGARPGDAAHIMAAAADAAPAAADAAPAAADAAPALAAPQALRATVTTDTAGARTTISSDYMARSDTIRLSARVPPLATDTVRLAVTDPPRFAGRRLAQALARRGIAVDSVAIRRDPAPAPPLRTIAALASPPLAEIVAAILQPSQNWIAEHVLKTLGAERGSEGSWRGGLAVERRYLSDVAGIDSLAFNLRDASGLSAQNLLTPAATVTLLDHVRAAPWRTQFAAALAAPGMTGSTLEKRLAPLAGRLDAKTGTIANVNALSGYLTTDSGRELTFSILSNGSGLPSATV
ncbi:MAG TPA: D-alanyl-D-alanine carboxypeptidase/D-alanyl-D-alanine-endopeptidase, partial [Longimicrobiales bacterium]|nr:D-alanyl-D-alanine carboxypeptidase/D-alanyl-D-alanine-endopeptidase [Longimicrobiales bacterium]